jgi:hypothetical protein
MVDNIIKLGFNFLFGIASVFGIGYVYSCIKNIDDQKYEDNSVKHDYILELIKKTDIIIKQNEKILLRLNTITDGLHFNNKIITEQYENIQNTMLKLIIDNPSSPTQTNDTNHVEKEEYDMIPHTKLTDTTIPNNTIATNSNNKGIFGLF